MKLQVALCRQGVMERLEADHLYALVVSTVPLVGNSQPRAATHLCLKSDTGDQTGETSNVFLLTPIEESKLSRGNLTVLKLMERDAYILGLMTEVLREKNLTSTLSFLQVL